MSGQWEIVGRNKKEKLPLTNKKPGKPEKKITPPTKVEDILPSSQVKSLYLSNGKSNKENRKPQEKEKPKETVKKQVPKKNEKNQETTKPKNPKSIESALNLIHADDIKTALDMSMQRFPDAPLVWLKEIASILNTKVSVELADPIFTNRPDGYLLSAIPVGIKQVMEKALNDAGKSNAQLFFDISLTAMANDLSKGHPAIGHKMWIQFLAFNNPQITVANLEKHAVLRTSYQNRQPIGLSILWALGQGGIKDFHVGLKVFKEFMMPLLEMKNYSRYVVQYLTQLLKRNENITLSKENYLYLLDLFHTKHSLSNDVAQQLSGLSKNLKAIVLSKGSDKKYALIFEPLLNKLVNSTSVTIKQDIGSTLVSFLAKDSNCYTAWRQIYVKTLQQSNNLLKYISEHWKKVSPQLDKKLLRETVQKFAAINLELSSNTKKDSLNEATATCKVLLNKMTVTKSVPWKFITFVLFMSTASFLAYDFNTHGGWKTSKSVRTLKDIGVWEYGEKTWDKANQGLNWTRQRIEECAPGYIDSVADTLQPYVEVTRDLGLVLYNLAETYKLMIIERTPYVLESIEKYAPGLIENTQEVLKTIRITSVEYWNKSYNYVTTQVFVGQLAPENMQKVIWQAFNSTQQYAVHYYHWVYEKIDTTVNGN